jgi:hypothetical protein
MRTLLMTMVITPFLTSFVLLGKKEARLPVSPESPTVTFTWSLDGKAPKLKDKEKFKDGAYANYSDAELTPLLIQEAMDQWNMIRGSYLQLSLSTTTGTLTPDKEDEQNFIIVEKAPSASVAAYAAPNVDGDTSLIKDCDIVINDIKTSTMSLLETLTHELGHCVGLGHPHSNYGAIMSYSRQGKSHRLSSDDKAGTIYLYPDPDYDASNPKEMIGCGAIKGAHGRTKTGAWIYLLFLIPFMIDNLRKIPMSNFFVISSKQEENES